MNWKVTALVSGLALMRPVVTFVLSEVTRKEVDSTARGISFTGRNGEI